MKGSKLPLIEKRAGENELSRRVLNERSFLYACGESYRRERFAVNELEDSNERFRLDIRNNRKTAFLTRSRTCRLPLDEMKRKNLARPSDSEGSIIIGEHVTLNRSVSQPGKLARPHTHDCEQLINVVEGTAWFRVGDEAKTVTAGDIIHVPEGTEHEFKNDSDGEFIYLSFKNKSGAGPADRDDD